MSTIDDFGSFETAWCPGCGNFQLLEAVKQALVASNIAPHEVLFVSGIGQAAKAPQYLNCNYFNGLHGRGLPVATGAKLANPALPVIYESGDGCTYGEGGNHFLAAARRNIGITALVHDNRVYGLTKGQASPTSQQGFETKAQPHGVFSQPFNAVQVAVAMRAGFVGRGFTGHTDHLADLIARAIAHPGFALVDIFQPCPSFNKLNNYAWFKNNTYMLGDEHNPDDWEAAMKLASAMDEQIPLGVIYRNDRPAFESQFATADGRPHFTKQVETAALREVMSKYA